MPKSKRDLLKRQIAHAYRNVSTAMDHIAQVEEPFAEQHEDFAKYLQVMIVTLDAVRNGLKDFCVKAWGSFPDNWETWRNVGNPDKSNYDE